MIQLKKLMLEVFQQKKCNLQEFTEKFHNEIEVTTRIAKSCKTKEQTNSVEKMFDLIEKKWANVINQNSILLLLFKSEEKRFYQELAKVKSNIVKI